MAVGTDLAFAAVTKTAATFAHRAARTIREPVVILLAAGSVPAAIATLAILANISATPQGLARVIRLSVAIAVLVSVALLLLRGSIRRWALHSAALDRVRRHRPAATVVAGALIGAAVALTSLGAGAIGAAILSLLYPEFEPAEIAGSDIAHAVPLTAIAAAGHAWLGTIDAGLLLALVTGGLPGIVAGSVATRSVPTHILRILLDRCARDRRDQASGLTLRPYARASNAARYNGRAPGIRAPCARCSYLFSSCRLPSSRHGCASGSSDRRRCRRPIFPTEAACRAAKA